MTVNTYHPEYSLAYPKWDKIVSVIDNDAQCYLRTIDPMDRSDANVLRNRQYKDDALLVNFSALTLEGLSGLIFRKSPKVKIPKKIDYIKDTATEDDKTLISFATDVVTEVIKLGRCGILVDFPRSESDLFTMDNNLTARMSLYTADKIINWTEARVNGKLQIIQVVLKECRNVNGSDGFSWVVKEQYRVLRLERTSDEDPTPIYRQHLYIENNIETTTPTDFNGEGWQNIPFTFVGAKDNTPVVSKSPIYDIVLLNVSHYKNSADLEESGHVVGQPTAIMKTNFDVAQFNEANPEGIRLGCRAVYNLGPEGDAKFLQVNPNQLVEMMMKHKEVQAAFIGARLIAPAGGRETAEAARMRFGSSNSQLAKIGYNCSQAIAQCIKWICKFEGADEKQVSYQLNDKFFDEGVDPNILMQAMLLVEDKYIPRRVVQDYLRDTGFVDDSVSNDELDDEIEGDASLSDLLLPPEDPVAPSGNGFGNRQN